ncbi:hypothetical protein [Thermus sp.]|uniref:hypothetical protein n=1 Tax=Thermus sp. TaxID=275 RepID=UPI003D14C0F6
MEALKALLDPGADPALRRRGLRFYGLVLFLGKGGVLLLLSFLLPRAFHPALYLLAFLGGLWLYRQGEEALKEEGPLAPLVAVGLGAALFFFLGVMGLLMRPQGLFLLLLGLGWGLALGRRAERAMGGRGAGP